MNKRSQATLNTNEELTYLRTEGSQVNTMRFDSRLHTGTLGALFMHSTMGLIINKPTLVAYKWC